MKVGCIALVQILPFSYSLFFLHPRVVMEAIWAIKWTSVKSQLKFVVVFYINPFFCTIFHKRLLPAENMDGWLSTKSKNMFCVYSEFKRKRMLH